MQILYKLLFLMLLRFAVHLALDVSQLPNHSVSIWHAAVALFLPVPTRQAALVPP